MVAKLLIDSICCFEYADIRSRFNNTRVLNLTYEIHFRAILTLPHFFLLRILHKYFDKIGNLRQALALPRGVGSKLRVAGGPISGSPQAKCTLSEPQEAADAGAACLRINPGNIGNSHKVKEVINAAKQNNTSIRIGVNAGSLEKSILDEFGEPSPEALVESALRHVRILKEYDFHNYKISVKASDVFLAVAAYVQLAEIEDCPLHIGITEAGSLRSGTVKSSIGLGNLLW